MGIGGALLYVKFLTVLRSSTSVSCYNSYIIITILIIIEAPTPISDTVGTQ